MSGFSCRNFQNEAGRKSWHLLAFAAAKTIPNPESRVLTFGNPPDITVVDDDSDRGSSLEKIALLRAQTNDYNQAVVVAKAIQDKKNRERLMQQIICYRQ